MKYRVSGVTCLASVQRSSVHTCTQRGSLVWGPQRVLTILIMNTTIVPHIFVWGSYFWGSPAPSPSSSPPPPLLLLCHPHGNPRHTRHSSSWALTPHTVTHSHHTLHTHYWHFIPHILCGVLTLGSRSFSFSSSSSSAPPPPRTSVRPSLPS